MRPALWLQAGGLAFLRDQGDGRIASLPGQHLADGVNGDAADSCRDGMPGWSGEEELVIVAAVEGLFEGGARAEGNGCSVEFGVEVGFFAEVEQVGGEAVADVNAGRGEFSALECLPGS